MLLTFILAATAASSPTRLTADFDGDGSLDEATISTTRGAEGGDRHVLTVRFTGTPHRQVWAPDHASSVEALTLVDAVELDGAPGNELIVKSRLAINGVAYTAGVEVTVLSVTRRGTTVLGSMPVGDVFRLEDKTLYTSGLREGGPFDCFRRQRWARAEIKNRALVRTDGGRMPASNSVHLLQDAVTDRSQRTRLLERVVALPVPTTNEKRCADTLRFTQLLAALIQLRIAEERGSTTAQPFFLQALQLAPSDEMGRAFTAAANALFDDTEPLAARLDLVEGLIRDFHSEEGLNEAIGLLLSPQRATP